ncbi:MAG: hypothetical protein IJD60_04900 [Clostridia bacterium]|nr:hypothetical protein [Clostridia bacterium]
METGGKITVSLGGVRVERGDDGITTICLEEEDWKELRLTQKQVFALQRAIGAVDALLKESVTGNTTETDKQPPELSHPAQEEL